MVECLFVCSVFNENVGYKGVCNSVGSRAEGLLPQDHAARVEYREKVDHGGLVVEVVDCARLEISLLAQVQQKCGNTYPSPNFTSVFHCHHCWRALLSDYQIRRVLEPSQFPPAKTFPLQTLKIHSALVFRFCRARFPPLLHACALRDKPPAQ